MGYGHRAFCLAAALKRAGLNDVEIRTKLYDEARYGHTPWERKADIKDLLRSLRKVGTLTRGAAGQLEQVAVA